MHTQFDDRQFEDVVVQAEYDVTPDDLLAWSVCHHNQSPSSRKQSRLVILLAIPLFLFLPGMVFLTSDKPFLETAQAIWPLLMGPVFFAVLYVLLLQWRRHSARQILAEGDPSKFLDRRVLALRPDGMHESTSSGSNHRLWTSVERILSTRDHAFVYTSGVEAFIIPRQSFTSTVTFEDFLQEIARRSEVEIKQA